MNSTNHHALSVLATCLIGTSSFNLHAATLSEAINHPGANSSNPPARAREHIGVNRQKVHNEMRNSLPISEKEI